MAKRRGVFRRLFNAVFKPRSEPSLPPVRPSAAPTPSRQSLRSQAANHIVSLLPLAKRDRVRDRVRQMTDDELTWTINATADQLRWRARQDADRISPVKMVPLNPWWYN